jgi:predicted nucleic acid-binding protein
VLLDSNIIIYASLPKYDGLRELIRKHSPKVSAVSHIEVLGYHQLTAEELKYFMRFFNAAMIIPVEDRIVATAIQLRQQKKMSLGDSIIASTALEHDLQLITRNTKDFTWIENLEVLNPIDNG